MIRIWLTCLYYFLDWRLVPCDYGDTGLKFRLNTETAWFLTRLAYGTLLRERRDAR